MCDVGLGLMPEHRHKAAELYYTAFRQKLHPIFRDEARGIAVLKRSMRPDNAIVAVCEGQLAGIAGFQSVTGSLTDISPEAMVAEFGFLGGWIRLLALAIFERKPAPGVMTMDGIVVDASMRGKGIGSQLLDATISHAKTTGYAQVRLDVVDTNPRARQLYERKGFVAVSTNTYPLTRRLFGFSGSTTMMKTV